MSDYAVNDLNLTAYFPFFETHTLLFNAFQSRSKITTSGLVDENSLRNKLKVVFCIGENASDKSNNKTFEILENQIKNALDKKFNLKDIIVAYEPVWSIGTGQIPKTDDLLKTTIFIKKVLKNIFSKKKMPIVLYGGSVDGKNISQFKKLNEIDGFLIGGASKSDQNFIDIIKNYYR